MDYPDKRLATTYGSISASNEVTAVTRVYWYRWYIIFLFGTIGFVQSIVWLTWSPISSSALCAYGFSDGDIEMLVNWNQIGFLFSTPIVVWILNTKRLRLAMVIAAFTPALGCGLQCLPVPVHVFKYFAHLSQILNSFGNCVILVGPTLFSNTWFPTSQRVTATCIASIIPVIGSAVGFVLGPNIVDDPSHNAINGSTCNISHSETKEIKHDIMELLYIEFTLSVIVFICTLIYFPNRPPLPPSVTASLERLDLKNSILPLSKNRTFIMYNMTTSLPGGVAVAFLSIFNLIVTPFGLSQATTGVIVLVGLLGGGALGLTVAWFADRWKGHLRVILISMYAVSLVASLYFMLITSNWFHVKWLQFSEVGVWISASVIGLVLSGTIPVASELIAESAFPASEAVSLGINIWFSTLFSFILLLVSGVSKDVSYATYMLVGSLLVVTFVLFFGKEPDSRLTIDYDPARNTDPVPDQSPLLNNMHAPH